MSLRLGVRFGLLDRTPIFLRKTPLLDRYNRPSRCADGQHRRKVMYHTPKRLEIDGLDKLLRITGAMLVDYEHAWKTEMMRRALAAYCRQDGARFPCRHLSRIAKHRNRYYAYLADEAGTLAVYRIGSESSFKRKAKRWPKAIEEGSSPV